MEIKLYVTKFGEQMQQYLPQFVTNNLYINICI